MIISNVVMENLKMAENETKNDNIQYFPILPISSLHELVRDVRTGLKKIKRHETLDEALLINNEIYDRAKFKRYSLVLNNVSEHYTRHCHDYQKAELPNGVVFFETRGLRLKLNFKKDDWNIEVKGYNNFTKEQKQIWYNTIEPYRNLKAWAGK